MSIQVVHLLIEEETTQIKLQIEEEIHMYNHDGTFSSVCLGNVFSFADRVEKTSF
jgi:hypothetical protein